jgi:hypothetical protein
VEQDEEEQDGVELEEEGVEEHGEEKEEEKTRKRAPYGDAWSSLNFMSHCLCSTPVTFM